MSRRQRIQAQYESWPYPHYPFFASVHRTHTWQLNLDYLWDRCGQGPAPAPSEARIWIAGCGTFQPYTFGLANPGARILATDISRPSLAIARRRCLWHGIYNCQFRLLDLNDSDSWPEGSFDLIECYGVLMNLEDPRVALEAMAARLSERGVLRLMVYPHYSRQRIFQIQRLARLLGLDATHAQHPGLLRDVITALPRAHPLRHAFDGYADSRNLQGIVDGFLHAGDRGLTGFQLGGWIEAAGLRPAFYFHRPWGQPERMARALRLQDRSQSHVLNYLDLWQELRSNFILCLTRSAPGGEKEKGKLRLHPLLCLDTRGTPLAYKLRLLCHRLLGITLPCRTEAEPIRLTGTELRRLNMGSAAEELTNLARRQGLVLGGEGKTALSLPPQEEWAEEEAFLRPRLEVGERAANPFYRHLFQAYSYAWDLESEIDRWRPHADPLEDGLPGDERSLGLTPFGTYELHQDEILAWLGRKPGRQTVGSYEELRFQNEEAFFPQVQAFLSHFEDLPARERSPAELRELWVLLFSHPKLFLDSEATGPPGGEGEKDGLGKSADRAPTSSPSETGHDE